MKCNVVLPGVNQVELKVIAVVPMSRNTTESLVSGANFVAQTDL